MYHKHRLLNFVIVPKLFWPHHLINSELSLQMTTFLGIDYILIRFMFFSWMINCMLEMQHFLFHRDWRGVAHFAEVNPRSLAQSLNPIEDVLKKWVENRIASHGTPPTLKDLQDILGQIDRWDVYDDTEEMISKLC